ncbi:MAG TPA: trypsin-like peptidase domain-containing protein [Blastocatellia bacterium]|nr:trypsin-like peptidase domain-containing protein [Blastocatellia bacterium]
MFVYLSGSEKGKTRIFTQNRVTIGTSETCDLKLVPEEGGTLPEGVLADIYDDGGAYHLAPERACAGIEIRVNGEEVNGDLSAPGYALQDGDSIQFGHGLSSASLLFQVMPENFTTAQLARLTGRAFDQSPAQPVHPLTATLFVKELTASLWAEIPRRIKLVALISTGLVVLVFLFAVYFNFLILHRNASEIERLRQQTAQEVARRQQDQEIIRSQQDELNRLREMSEQARRFAQKISERYSPGVCLIVGSYSFVERGTGRILKYEAADDANETPVDANGNLLASVTGAGPPVRIEYTGTGFVIEEGVISTNKHVVRPWASDAIAQIILQQGGGFRPQLDTLMAFFPSIQSPFKLREVIVSQRYDIALCSFEQSDAAVPVIPLSRDDPQSMIGDPVVLLGYPTGVDGLLQRIDENERREILKLNGGSAEDVAAGLAQRGLIRPLTTTGTISDALAGRIVHSAQTTEGGSGSPMFDRDGQVIAINSAILTTIDGNQSFGGSNFGVPVKMVNDLLAAYRRGQTTLD